MRSLFNLFNRQEKEVANRKEQTMTEQKQNKKRNYTCYVYGQIYANFLKQGKKDLIKVKNVHVREWKNILGWLKRNEYIVNYELGNKVETAGEVVIQGFNEEKTIYKKYLEAIAKNVEKEQA